MIKKTYETILAENERFLTEKGLIVKKVTHKEMIRSGNERFVGMFMVSKKSIVYSSTKNKI